MRRSFSLAIAVLLAAGPALAQSAPESAASAQPSPVAQVAAKPNMKRVCRVRDSGNPMRPDRICRLVPVAGTSPAAPADLAAAPGADQLAQNLPAPHF